MQNMKQVLKALQSERERLRPEMVTRKQEQTVGAAPRLPSTVWNLLWPFARS